MKKILGIMVAIMIIALLISPTTSNAGEFKPGDMVKIKLDDRIGVVLGESRVIPVYNNSFGPTDWVMVRYVAETKNATNVVVNYSQRQKLDSSDYVSDPRSAYVVEVFHISELKKITPSQKN